MALPDKEPRPLTTGLAVGVTESTTCPFVHGVVSSV